VREPQLGTALSPEFEVVRHCNLLDVDDEVNPLHPTPNASAFRLRPNEPYLSVNCPDIFADLPDKVSRLQQILNDLRTKPGGRKVKSSHWFAPLSVGEILKLVCESNSEHFRVELEAEAGDESHSGIYGQSGATDDDERNSLQTAIAACASGPAIRVSDLE